MSDLISKCRIAAKDCYLYNSEKTSEYGNIYTEAADRIAELEAKLGAANLAAEIFCKDKEKLEAQLDTLKFRIKCLRSEAITGADEYDKWKAYHEAQLAEANKNGAIAEEYLCSLVVSHPHLVPHDKISDTEYRLTIYDTEQAILEKSDE